MATSSFLGSIPTPYFRCSLPPQVLNRTTPLAASTSTTTTRALPPDAPFAAADYLVQSCGLPPDKSLKASRHLRHLKTPDRPDAVLRFLRQIGVTESDIRTAVLRNSRILCSSVERNQSPNIAKLQEVGLSIDEISGIISRNPNVFLSNFVPKVDFWLGILGSVQNLSLVLRREPAVLKRSIERVVIPNLSFLQEQCGLSVPQTIKLIKMAPRLVISNPATLKVKAERADNLGIPRSSQTYLYALLMVHRLSQRSMDARLENFKSFGISEEEIAIMISRAPLLLSRSWDHIARKFEFLIIEAGCSKSAVVQNPVLLMYSLHNRLIPRTVVRNLLISKEIPAGNRAFASFVQPCEEDFVETFVLPYEHAIPGIYQAYADAGKTGGID